MVPQGVGAEYIYTTHYLNLNVGSEFLEIVFDGF